MSWIYEGLRWLHFGAGAVALVLFWVPALTRKGSPIHRRAGRVYLRAMGIVVATAVPLSATLSGAATGPAGRSRLHRRDYVYRVVVRTAGAQLQGRRRGVPHELPRRVGVLNALSAVAVLAMAWTVAPPGFVRTLFTIFPAIGLLAAWSTWQFFRHPPTDRRWW